MSTNEDTVSSTPEERLLTQQRHYCRGEGLCFKCFQTDPQELIYLNADNLCPVCDTIDLSEFSLEDLHALIECISPTSKNAAKWTTLYSNEIKRRQQVAAMMYM